MGPGASKETVRGGSVGENTDTARFIEESRKRLNQAMERIKEINRAHEEAGKSKLKFRRGANCLARGN